MKTSHPDSSPTQTDGRYSLAPQAMAARRQPAVGIVAMAPQQWLTEGFDICYSTIDGRWRIVENVRFNIAAVHHTVIHTGMTGKGATAAWTAGLFPFIGQGLVKFCFRLLSAQPYCQDAE